MQEGTDKENEEEEEAEDCWADVRSIVEEGPKKSGLHGRPSSSQPVGKR